MQIRIEDPPPSLILNSVQGTDAGADSLVQREKWFNIIEDYSSRGLTVPSDELPALSGLVRV